MVARSYHVYGWTYVVLAFLKIIFFCLFYFWFYVDLEICYSSLRSCPISACSCSEWTETI